MLNAVKHDIQLLNSYGLQNLEELHQAIAIEQVGIG
jgi:hypothetical protein